MKQLKAALVGAGAFGHRYMESLRSMPGVELSWVCDLNSELCRSAVDKFRVPNMSTVSATHVRIRQLMLSLL